MSWRIYLAIMVQLLVMGLVLLQPLMVTRNGTVSFLETEKMDPRALFRGDYVILGYTLAQGILSKAEQRGIGRGDPVYVTITTARPAEFVAVGLEKPELNEGQACLVGRSRGSSGAVDFPQIAQFFVPEGTGRALEQARGKDLLAKVASNQDCKAVLLGLERR